jgi:2-C-methyl-D-erythritol 2,4-cyclodiphosphate synthase
MSDHRIGHGYDIHRLREGGELVMGGVVVAEGVSAVAHSDGDVVIHALVDALLGAAGKGDIGEHFPDTDAAWKGAPSMKFLDIVYKDLRREGWRVINADLTILAEKPRLRPFKERMTAFLEKHLEAPVNIKAGTNEGCDAIGRGEAVAAHAVVLLMRNG